MTLNNRSDASGMPIPFAAFSFSLFSHHEVKFHSIDLINCGPVKLFSRSIVAAPFFLLVHWRFFLDGYWLHMD